MQIRSLLTLLVVSATLSSAADADVRLCNMFPETLRVAVMTGYFEWETRDDFQTYHYQVDGWQSIEPGRCRTISPFELDNTNNLWIEYYAYTVVDGQYFAHVDDDGPTNEYCVHFVDTFQVASSFTFPSREPPICDAAEGQTHANNWSDVVFFHTNTEHRGTQPHYSATFVPPEDIGRVALIDEPRPWENEQNGSDFTGWALLLGGILGAIAIGDAIDREDQNQCMEVCRETRARCLELCTR